MKTPGHVGAQGTKVGQHPEEQEAKAPSGEAVVELHPASRSARVRPGTGRRLAGRRDRGRRTAAAPVATRAGALTLLRSGVGGALGLADEAARRAVLARLQALDQGILTVDEAGRSVVFGRPAADGLAARVTVKRPRLWRRLALSGSLGAAEAWLDEDWDADDLVAALRLFTRNERVLQGLDGLAPLRTAVERGLRLLAPNTRAGARRHIAAHYDLGNDFFALMLDPTLTYSCGLFEREGATLEQASVAKIDRLCRLLGLQAGHRLVEIGSGWGGLALHAASHYGCSVVTTTLSRAQHELATELVRRAGLTGKVEVLLADYRDLRGRFDRLVSVEMIEAIGAEQYQTFFRTCGRLLAEDGLAAIQAITIADRHYEAARRGVEFVKRFIFPGGCIPSVTALLEAATAASDLTLRSLADIGPHYATTLAAWRANLEAHREAVAALTTPRFRREWHLYLCWCEAGFRERYLSDVQLLFARPGAE